MNEQTSEKTNPVPASWAREPDGDQTLEENWLFRLRRERYRSRASGKAHDFYVMRLADSVNVVALTPDRQVILVEQFRAGSGRDSLETPGGLLDEGEDPLQAGVRELLEETGYAGDDPVLLGVVWSNPSILSSRNATILIQNARPVAQPHLDEGEEVRVELVPSQEIPRLLRNGRIGHALAVQGLLWWLVAELPETPLQLPETYHPRQRQIGLGRVMFLVAAIALGLAMLRAISDMHYLIGLTWLYLFLLPCSYLIAGRYLDPLPRTTLTRHLLWSNKRITGRLLTMLGLNQILLAIFAFILMFVDL